MYILYFWSLADVTLFKTAVHLQSSKLMLETNKLYKDLECYYLDIGYTNAWEKH